MPVKVIEGKRFHARDFFYVGDPEEVGTWKLRKGENPDMMDPTHVSGAANAIGPSGFRGQKAQIPREALPGVKRKILAAMRKLDYDEEHIKDTFSWLFGEGQGVEGMKGQSLKQGSKPEGIDPLHKEPLKDNFIEMEVFKAGDYGSKGNYTEADLQQIADDYDRNLHHAPVTVDHKQTGPAYGWVDSLKRVGNKLVAKLSNLSKDLVQAIKEKRYGKRSIELYGKMRETGKPYLRALSILGAQVPEVKGLDPIELSDDGCDFLDIDFYEGGVEDMAGLKALEADLNVRINDELKKENEELERKFAEAESEKEKLKEKAAKAELEKEELAKKFAEEKARQKHEQDLKDAKAWIEQKVESGNITPAQRDAGLCNLLVFLEGLGEKYVIKFGETEKRPADVLKDVIGKVKILDFKEVAPREPENLTEFAEISRKAKDCGVSVREYQEACKQVAKYPKEEGMTPELWIEANTRFGEDSEDEE